MFLYEKIFNLDRLNWRGLDRLTRNINNLFYFAAFKNHIGFYPAPSGIANFLDELLDYKTSKGAVQFPLDKPIPFDLISKIVKFRVKENKQKNIAKKRK